MLLQAAQLRDAAGLGLVASRHVQPLCCTLVHAQAAVTGGQRTRPLGGALWPGEVVGCSKQLLCGRRVAPLQAVRRAVPQHRVHACHGGGAAVQGHRHVVPRQRLQRQLLTKRPALLLGQQGLSQPQQRRHAGLAGARAAGLPHKRADSCLEAGQAAVGDTGQRHAQPR